MQTLYWTKFKS